MGWWKRRRPHVAISRQPVPIRPPYANMTPSLDFDVEAFVSPPCHSFSFEKAILNSKQSRDTFRSDAPTLTSTTPYLDHPIPLCHQQPVELPQKRYSRFFRHLRLTLLTVYRRVFTTVILANVICLLVLLGRHSIKLDTLATAASSNFLAAILIRQDFTVNAIFRTAWLVPWSVPLRLRRSIARCYCYGGVHSGTAVAGTMWWMVFSIVLTIRFANDAAYTPPLLVATYAILGLLVLVLVLSFPMLRSRYHNTFELTHRFLGWASILLFWAQLLLLVAYTTSTGSQQSVARSLLHNPTFYNLTFITILLMHPWMRLRKWTFTPELLSSHAVRLHFTKRVHKFSCLSISSSPLEEWHPFATFPSRDRQQGHSMIISDAGDWTRSVIHRAQELARMKAWQRYAQRDGAGTMRFWIKGSVKAGVLSLSCIFKRVVIVTTGSGVGPSLSSLLDRPPSQSVRLVWSTRSPLLTYGTDLYRQVLRADPGALIIDTTSMGRPDLVSVAWKMYKETEAEAVFVLSNESVTRKVVYGLESRGVPAFGPIWDS